MERMMTHPRELARLCAVCVAWSGTAGAHLSVVYYREEVCRKEGREDGTVGAHLSMVYIG